ncbi:hypothetical protein OROGR_020529 [Orobanche gracilis]
MTSTSAPPETKEHSEYDSSIPENQNSDSSQSGENTTAQDKRLEGHSSTFDREHFEKYDEPLMEKVDGILTQVGSYKRAECKHCHASLVGDSRGGTSLKKHLD